MTTKLTFGLILSLGIATTAFAQQGRVGINTPTPAATLDVVAKNADPAVVDGVIAPRLTGDELQAKDAVYLAPQTGALVYATSAVTTPGGTKTANVTSAGYYYFNGAVWVKVASPVASADNTDDEWINNTADTRIELGKTSVKGTRAAGTEFVALDNGNVGIGTATPVLGKLVIEDNTLNDTKINGAKLEFQVVQSNTSAVNVGVSADLRTLATDAAAHNILIATNTNSYHSGSGLINEMRAVSGDVSIFGSGKVNRAVAHYGSANTFGTATLDAAVGGELYVRNYGPGVITEANGLLTYVSNTGSGTITNGYGLLIKNISATNKWAIYSSDATAASYIAGRVGIGLGNTAPSNNLEVKSGVANTSGVRFTNLKSTSPVTAGATTLGVNANGDVVTVDNTFTTTNGTVELSPSFALNSGDVKHNAIKFTLPSAGTYLVSYTIRALFTAPTAINAIVTASIITQGTAAGTVVGLSEINVARYPPGTGNAAGILGGNGTGTVALTTTRPVDYYVRIANTGGTDASINSSGTGRSTVTYVKISN